ncbi:hypothetical protein [Pseudoclavibacter soli]|uniref:hypothetical protein n=1 Tax=Pseudoclavibacter soli TaxID=452623 RepID=UPI00041BAABB|nr:hypothetical protein [Pseudoclavibacter soli]
MSRAFWFVAGVVGGFVAAHEINKTERGREFFALLNERTQEFTEAVSEAYRSYAAQAAREVDSSINE